MTILQTAIELLCILYFAYVVAYSFIFSIAGLFYKNIKLSTLGFKGKFAVFIPSYKDDEVIVDVARKALVQDYPHDRFDVIVIADSLRPDTVSALRQLPIKVVEVSFDKSTKVKSLNRAMEVLQDDYDYAVILDADNIMQKDFLTKINAAHQTGLKAVQGQRLPKNRNNSLSFLDGLSEAINNHIYRQGSTALGLSAAINGSGVSFNYDIFKGTLRTMTSIGGFDRELEILLLNDKIKVFYLKEAGVYDEKVQKSEVFKNQRKRWISSQYYYLRKYFGKGIGALLRGNFTYFNASVLRNIQLPRLLNIGLLTVFTILAVILNDHLNINYLIWPLLFGLLAVSLLVAIPRDYYNKDLLKAIFKLPGIFIGMLVLMFKLKGANKRFIHTPHYSVDIDLDKKAVNNGK